MRAARTETIEEARRHACSLASGLAPRDAWLAAAVLLADVLAGIALERPLDGIELEPMLAAFGESQDPPPALVEDVTFLLAVRSPMLFRSPEGAAEAVLQLLGRFAPANEVSLWLRRSDNGVRLAASAGVQEPTRTCRTAAQRALSGAATSSGSGSARKQIHAIPVECRGERIGALVFRAGTERGRAIARAEEAAVVLGLLFDFGALEDEMASSRVSLIEGEELILRMVGFDIHDGPLQELARLRGDLQVVRRRFAEGSTAPDAVAAIARQLDSMIGLAVGAENGLRAMARSLAVPPYFEEPFGIAIEKELATLGGTRIRHKLITEGTFDSLPHPQRIAVVSILREALANARAHSGATEILVTLCVDDARARLEIVDNGVGFDVERSLSRAARGGRLGLISIRERTRLLGGSCAVTSKPGGPTKLSVVLPVQRP